MVKTMVSCKFSLKPIHWSITPSEFHVKGTGEFDSEPHFSYETMLKNGDLSYKYGLTMIDPPNTGLKTKNNYGFWVNGDFAFVGEEKRWSWVEWSKVGKPFRIYTYIHITYTHNTHTQIKFLAVSKPKAGLVIYRYQCWEIGLSRMGHIIGENVGQIIFGLIIHPWKWRKWYGLHTVYFWFILFWYFCLANGPYSCSNPSMFGFSDSDT